MDHPGLRFRHRLDANESKAYRSSFEVYETYDRIPRDTAQNMDNGPQGYISIARRHDAFEHRLAFRNVGRSRGDEHCRRALEEFGIRARFSIANAFSPASTRAAPMRK
ncbi:hypothetical protein KM043_012183 [Ampulex compressa]|nr:hypothetical protein KM043_012183 [Ampulex compressa]